MQTRALFVCVGFWSSLLFFFSPPFPFPTCLIACSRRGLSSYLTACTPPAHLHADAHAGGGTAAVFVVRCSLFVVRCSLFVVVRYCGLDPDSPRNCVYVVDREASAEPPICVVLELPHLHDPTVFPRTVAAMIERRCITEEILAPQLEAACDALPSEVASSASSAATAAADPAAGSDHAAPNSTLLAAARNRSGVRLGETLCSGRCVICNHRETLPAARRR